MATDIAYVDVVPGGGLDVFVDTATVELCSPVITVEVVS